MSKLKQLTTMACNQVRNLRARWRRRLIVLVVFVLAALGASLATAQSASIQASTIVPVVTTVTTTSSSYLPASPTTTSTSLPPVTAAPTQRKASQEPTRGVKRTPISAPVVISNCSSSKEAAHSCWDGLIGKYSWNTTTAFRIMWCESRGNPNARNPHSTARGLFQILGGPLDPEANVRQAFAMYSQRGWQPWVCK